MKTNITHKPKFPIVKNRSTKLQSKSITCKNTRMPILNERGTNTNEAQQRLH